jgi:xylulokinase
VWRPRVRASLHGLTAAHTRAHVARAVLEGLTFSTAAVVLQLWGLLALHEAEVVLVGGGARSRVWAQLRADIMDRVHRVAANVDTCPLGAAMIASVAARAYPSLAAAAAQLPPPVETFTPVRPSEELVQSLVEYTKLVERLVVSGDV